MKLILNLVHWSFTLWSTARLNATNLSPSLKHVNHLYLPKDMHSLLGDHIASEHELQLDHNHGYNQRLKVGFRACLSPRSRTEHVGVESSSIHTGGYPNIGSVLSYSNWGKSHVYPPTENILPISPRSDLQQADSGNSKLNTKFLKIFLDYQPQVSCPYLHHLLQVSKLTTRQHNVEEWLSGVLSCLSLLPPHSGHPAENQSTDTLQLWKLSLWQVYLSTSCCVWLHWNCLTIIRGYKLSALLF